MAVPGKLFEAIFENLSLFFQRSDLLSLLPSYILVPRHVAVHENAVRKLQPVVDLLCDPALGVVLESGELEEENWRKLVEPTLLAAVAVFAAGGRDVEVLVSGRVLQRVVDVRERVHLKVQR